MEKQWFGSVVYQIYPRSFYDSNGTGIGDLKGITAKLDYIKSLHVDAIWISPFFKSPMKDFGYDVSNYREVDPIFGNMEDFDALLEACHRLDIKVLIDMVLNHTSSAHDWFRASRSSKNNPKSNWYVWADAKPDGSPPNNWLSLFGGPAWSWESRRHQYYLHNFLRSQPDLNLQNTEVQHALLEECKFWFDKGVDGLRLDACNFYFCDPQLRDNPPIEDKDQISLGVNPSNPYGMQLHHYDKSQAENLQFLKELRTLADSYAHKPILVAEIFDDNNLELTSQYIEPDGPLHTAYSFQFLGEEFDTNKVREFINFWKPGQEPVWTFGNHDVCRLASRWKDQAAGDDFVRQIYAFLTCVKGMAFIYQGDELGLPEAEIPLEKLKDPYGIEFYPDYKGRDGCRTPMPWNQNVDNSQSWLPIPEQHFDKTVEQQNEDPKSLLNFVRQCFDQRANNKILRHGTCEWVDQESELITLLREFEGQSILCAFNFSASSQTLDTTEFKIERVVSELSYKLESEQDCIRLLPGGFLALKLDN